MNSKSAALKLLCLLLLLSATCAFAAPPPEKPAAAAPGAAPPPKPAAPAAAAPAAPSAPTAKADVPAPQPVPPEKMDSKTLLYPRTMVRQEIEIGKTVVPAVIGQLLAGTATGPGSADPAEAKRVEEMLSSEAVRTALSGAVRLLVVSMTPAAGDTAGAAAPAASYYEGDRAAAYYGDLFAQHRWTSAIRTVEPTLRKSFHLLLAPEAKGLFFVVADQHGLTTVLALSDASLRPLLDVLAPILGRGIFPTGLPTPSASTEPAPPR